MEFSPEGSIVTDDGRLCLLMNYFDGFARLYSGLVQESSSLQVAGRLSLLGLQDRFWSNNINLGTEGFHLVLRISCIGRDTPENVNFIALKYRLKYPAFFGTFG